MALNTFLASIVCLATTLGAQDRPRLPVVDAQLQASIQAIVHSPEDVTAAERGRDLDALRRLSGAGFERLVPQLFLYSSRATTTREAMAFGGIVAALRVPGSAVVRSLVPLLEIDDAGTRSGVAGLLAEYEGRSAERRPNFEHYRSFFTGAAARGEALPVGLLRYLFEEDPGVAVLLLMSVERAPIEEQRTILWAEHVIAEIRWQEAKGFRERGAAAPAARAELLRMTRHAAWYARLYAVQLLVEAPHLGELIWLEALAQDADARVQRAARAGMTGAAR